MRQLRAVGILVICLQSRAATTASETIDQRLTTADTRRQISVAPPSDGHGPPESTYNREELLEQRERATRSLEVVQKMLKATSHAARSEIYCRDRESESFIRMKLFSEGLSPDGWQATYVGLLRDKPEKKDGEEERQRKLQMVGGLLRQYESKVEWCRGMLLQGILVIPSNAAELERNERAQEEIRRIDHLLTSHEQVKSSATTSR